MTNNSHLSVNCIDSHGTKIYFDQTGNNGNFSIICLHGLASNATRWQEFISNSKLQEHGKLLAPDLRGHARSMFRKHYSRKDWVLDLDTLVDASKTPCVLIGHSMGAQIALEYAMLHADKITGLVLIDPVFPQALSGLLRKVSRVRLLLQLFVRVLRGIYALGLYQRVFPKRSLYQLDLKTREFLRNNPDKTIADLYMNPLADLKFIPLANYLQDLIEVTRPLPPLNQVKASTLVLLSQGASTSNVETNKKILSDLTDCQITPLHADHWLLTEKPVEAREVIDEWCLKHLGL